MTKTTGNLLAAAGFAFLLLPLSGVAAGDDPFARGLSGITIKVEIRDCEAGKDDPFCGGKQAPSPADAASKGDDPDPNQGRKTKPVETGTDRSASTTGEDGGDRKKQSKPDAGNRSDGKKGAESSGPASGEDGADAKKGRKAKSEAKKANRPPEPDKKDDPAGDLRSADEEREKRQKEAQEQAKQAGSQASADQKAAVGAIKDLTPNGSSKSVDEGFVVPMPNP